MGIRPKKDITYGPIADRVVTALNNCPAAEFLRLYRNGCFNLTNDNYFVTVPSLKIDCMNEYIKASGVSAYQLLFGDEIYENAYTENDTFVISALDMMPAQDQERLLQDIREVFPKQLPNKLQGMRISHKIMHLFSLLPYGWLSGIAKGDQTIPGYDKLSEDARAHIARFHTTRSETVVYPLDIIPSVASFLGISLHLIMELDVPLYCKTNEGDILFDWYTLMTPGQKETFLNYLTLYINKKRQIPTALDLVDPTIPVVYKAPELFPTVEGMQFLPYNYEEQAAKSLRDISDEINAENIYEVGDKLLNGFRKALPLLPKNITPDSLVETQKYLDKLFAGSKPAKVPFFHLLHYWSVIGGVSCHEIMYNGFKMEIELFGVARFVVHRFSELTEKERDNMMRYLSFNRDVFTNPVYTLFMRSRELADASSVSVDLFWVELIKKKKGSLRSQHNKFRYDEIDPHEGVPHHMSWLASYTSMWWTSLLLCPGMNLCMDFFAIQDYSHLAVFNGRKLREDERAFLSAFLNANEYIQKQAIALLLPNAQ